MQINVADKLARARLFAHYFVVTEISKRKDKIKRSSRLFGSKISKRKDKIRGNFRLLGSGSYMHGPWSAHVPFIRTWLILMTNYKKIWRKLS